MWIYKILVELFLFLGCNWFCCVDAAFGLLFAIVVSFCSLPTAYLLLILTPRQTQLLPRLELVWKAPAKLINTSCDELQILFNWIFEGKKGSEEPIKWIISI